MKSKNLADLPGGAAQFIDLADFDRETLSRRLVELEDIRMRTEDQAADAVAVAEELYIARQEAEKAKKRADDSASTVKAILEALAEGVVVIKPDWRIETVNPAAKALICLDGRRASGERLPDLIELAAPMAFPDIPSDMGEVAGIDGSVRRGDGRHIPIEMSMREFRTAAGQRFAVVLSDVGERKEAEKTILELALNDALTGLANRNLFHRRLEDALAASARSGKPVALMYLDLDKFKDINDDYGHPIGDGLLIEVAERLTEATRKTDTVARLGGDEFAIVATEVENRETISILAARIIEGLSEPMTIDATLLKTGTSIGISFYPEDASDADELIRLADLALYGAKSAGRGTFQLYDENLQSEIHKNQVIENDMKIGLVRGEFEVHYQPIVDSVTERPVAAEALVRWRHPTHGLLPPLDFIPIAEERGLIGLIGKQVLNVACAQNKAWQDSGAAPIRVAVNISPHQFLSDDLIDDVAEALESSRLASEWLEIEITESMVILDLETVRGRLNRLHDLGVQLSIDDFGTGFCSLLQLKQFPIDRLKIDRAFIQDVASDIDSAAISKSVLDLGRSMGLEVVAEGVETEDQISFLRANDCPHFQGFAFGKPCPGDAFLEWLEETNVA